MKNKKLLLGFLLISALVLTTACGRGTAGDIGRPSLDGFRRPDFGQPDREPDIRGLVKSITGNEVTILKLDRPERGTGDNKAGTGENANGENGAANANRMAGTVGIGTGSRGGRMPMMGMSGPGGAGGTGTTDRAEILKQLAAMSTGSETVTIPVGIQMLKTDTANTESAAAGGRGGNMNMVEAALSDIQADKMVSIWLDKSVTDRKVASFVLVMR